MPAQASETFVLRTYPLREADLIVSFFTRDHGKLRGVARRARRPKNSFGSGLERLSQVRMFYFQRENRELVNLDGCELIQSQFDLMSDYAASVALDYMAEVSEQLLPPNEPSERFFRLIAAVLAHLREKPSEHVWPCVLYYTLWAVRLSGFLPDVRVGRESHEIAQEMMQKPIDGLRPRQWSSATAGDLRRALIRSIEEHVERRLVTAAVLETL
ncbi:MAG TPA: DNA repair protein RecO [Bryobacteraceae bacterium]|nr:DNA repair protein RecO [Bryobacteraceae bacterium]